MINKLKKHTDPGLDREIEQIYRYIRSPLWNDINFSASNLKPGSSSPAWQAITGGLFGYVFEDAKVQELHGCEEILHGYRAGTDIIPHIHWAPTTTNTGTVRFGLEYAWVNFNENATGTTTIYAASAAPGTIGSHRIIAFPAIPGAGKKHGSYFCMRLFRDGTNAADTFTGGAFVPQFGLHYQIDAHGSAEIATKNII